MPEFWDNWPLIRSGGKNESSTIRLDAIIKTRFGGQRSRKLNSALIDEEIRMQPLRATSGVSPLR